MDEKSGTTSHQFKHKNILIDSNFYHADGSIHHAYFSVAK